MTGPSPLLEIRDFIVRRGGAAILDIPELSVMEGEVLSLIGPNGAGKSTLLLGLSGIDRPDRGHLLFRGEVLDGQAASLAYRRKIAMVFQEPLLFKTTVFENVAAGLRIRGLDRHRIEKRVLDSLDRFRIVHLRNRSTRTLSGGEAQRTSLARALAVEPEVLLLDEPFASLDPPTREALMDDLEVTLRQTGTTTVVATHDRLEALRLSDRMAVMQAGRILQLGPPGEVMNRPANEFVASFVGVETILSGRVMKIGAGTITAGVGDKVMEAVGEAAPGESVLLCIRPENVTLSAQPPGPGEKTSARNMFPGNIEKILPQGYFQKVILNCGFPLAAYVTNLSLEEMSLKEGRMIVASFKATAVHMIRTRHAPPG